MTVITEAAELFEILQDPIRLSKENFLMRFIATASLEPLVQKAKQELALIQAWKEEAENAFYS